MACVVCLHEPASYLCTPCGHQCGCIGCLEAIKRSSAGCPICRADIESIVRVFNSASDINDAEWIKEGVQPEEYKAHQMAYEMLAARGTMEDPLLAFVRVPALVSFDQNNNTLCMQKVPGTGLVGSGVMNLSDWYGEDASCVEAKEYALARAAVKRLAQGGLLYHDITGYNFIRQPVGDKIILWMVDFEHATVMRTPGVEAIDDEFVQEFVEGSQVNQQWNPDYK